MKPDAPQLAPIVMPLESARRKVRLIAASEGLAYLLWTSLGVAIAIGLTDWLVHLPGVVRMLLSVALLIYAAIGLVRWVVRPLVLRLSLDAIAARVENEHPWLQDRLRSSLTFSADESDDSRELRQTVLSETLASMQKVDASRITSTHALRRSMLLLIAPLAILVALLALQPGLVHIALNRLIAPMAGVNWPKSVQIQLVKALPQSVPVGQRLELSARLSKGDRPGRKVLVSWQIGGQAIQQQLMQRADDGTFAAAIDVRSTGETDNGTMRLWIESADDSIGPVPVQLVPRLQVKSVKLHAEAPAYCKIAPEDFDLRVQPASVPAGSDLQLSLVFNRAISSVTIEPVGSAESASAPAVAWQRPGETTANATWTAGASLRFRLRAQDPYGYSNPVAEEYELIVRPDQSPSIQLESPRRSEDRTPDATVPLVASLEDDYGIDKLVLEARLLTAEQPTTAPAATQPASVMDLVLTGKAASAQVTFSNGDIQGQRRRYRMEFPWKLISFPSSLIKPGDVIEFQLATTDTFNLGGQTHTPVKTPPLRITIVTQEQLLQRIYDELRQVASQLSEVKSRQDRLRSDTAQLQDDLSHKAKPDESDEALMGRIADQQSRAASQTKELASRLAGIEKRLNENASPNKQLSGQVGQTNKLLETAAEENMKPAAASVKQSADRAASPEQRKDSLSQASDRQKKASEQLSQALDTLGDLGGIGRAIDMVQDLLSKQRGVSEKTSDFAKAHAGQRPEDMKQEDRERLDRMARDQNDLAKATEQTLDQLKAMSQRQGSDQASADALKQAAETGQQQSVPQHQQKAGEAMSQNQSSQASSSQSSAESGLQQMLNSLKEAQRHKLEQLVRRLAQMQEQLRTLIRRQAGHNLDNLSIRHVDDARAIEELTRKSQRNGDVGAVGNATQLADAQRQTHQNASDLVDALDKVKGASEAAANLSKAASRMERAVALIRKDQLAEAFAPPQGEALQALELALKQLSDIKKDLEGQQNAQKQEQLRKAYEALRAQQVQVRDATKLLDESITASGGKPKRGDLVRLQQLAADQGKLAADIKPLTRDLAELGSDVFVKASEATGEQMNSMAARLSQQKTQKPTQLGQGQIVARIDAIIRGLTPPQPDESKYASRSGGGSGSGSGASKRKLPPAAELMLIRDLQQLVNSGTSQTTPEEKDILSPLSKQQSGIRQSFDAMIKKVLRSAKLPDEKQSREPVPEETADSQQAADALDVELLSEPVKDEGDMPDVALVARRMTRSQVRLGEQDDPGKLTQAVQEKIIKALDKLIQEAKQQPQQQAQGESQSQQQGEADPNAQPKPTDANANANSQTPAGKSQLSPGATPPSPSGDIRETAKEWGGISDRDRQAIIESTGESIMEKYRTLTEDYYRALSTKGAENK